jgi:hypothetical protein
MGRVVQAGRRAGRFVLPSLIEWLCDARAAKTAYCRAVTQ